MKHYELEKFKKNFELFSYIFVYVGGLIHLINFFENSGFLMYVIIGYIIAIIFMANAFFNPVIVILHNVIISIYIEDLFPNFQDKLLYYLFYIPFYIMILYSIISILGIEEKLNKKKI